MWHIYLCNFLYRIHEVIPSRSNAYLLITASDDLRKSARVQDQYFSMWGILSIRVPKRGFGDTNRESGIKNNIS